MNLFEVNAAYMAAEDRLFSTVSGDGELDPEALAEFEAAKANRDAFIENCILYDKNDKALLEAIKAEKKVLDDRIKTLTNRIEWREGLLTTMLDGHKFETAKAKASFRKSDKVVVIDINEVPEMYKKTKTEVTADKTAIKASLKAGTEVAGCALETYLNIQIK